ncbi:MAG: cytochrome c-type biogenesis CcmF C-terminal domain-containing protein [Anaerolineae bacterium]|nr:cytochrome c biogenesis protein CcsA [Anaerolineae bacterium]MDW8102362.1 cytochrome c-type biogenesis CcmF C-terminal domain-containing protein [Anaerolineae bacterium]
MAIIGYASVQLALVVSLYAVLSFLVARARGYRELRESARRALQATTILVTLASFSLIYLLLRRDFTVEYVFRHTSTTLSPLYAFSAFWAGQEGSLLLWLWLLSIFTLLVSINGRKDEEAVQDYALAVLAAVEAFFTLVIALLSNPFSFSPHPFSEGMGLNPLLENLSMVVHPPTIFAGYAGLTVPFAYAIAYLLAGKPFEELVRRVRVWTIVAWVFLGAGIIIGGWWAYIELGWGGYWAWDPVENSSLLPWLTATAFLHSSVVTERRHYLKNWSFWLITLSFLLCFFATFVTRSGFIQSVHAFAESPVGLYFLAFIVFWSLLAGVIFFKRRTSLSDKRVEGHWLSRDTAFYLLNWLFLGEALMLFLGIVFPALVLLFQGREANVGISFYHQTFMPLVALTLLIMGFCAGLSWQATFTGSWFRRFVFPTAGAFLGFAVPFLLGERDLFPLLSWGVVGFSGAGVARELFRGFWEFWRKRRFIPRPYGGYLAHAGIILLALGVAGSSFYKTDVLVSLKPGETVEVGGYTLKYVNFQHQSLPDKERFQARVEVYSHHRLLGEVRPEKNFHYHVEQWVSEIGLRSTPAEDLYIILAGLEEDGTATFQVEINPGVFWIWVGGGLLILGAVLSLWPRGG